jgi:hypothetical protein
VSTLVASAVDGGLSVLDWVRGRLLLALMPWSSTLVARRELRVACWGVLLVSLALLGSLTIPLWLLALTPIVLGVPHLIADVRYGVVRTGWPGRPALWFAAGLPLLALCLGAPLPVGLAAVAGACMAARAPTWRRLIGVALAAGLGCLALWFSHAFNLVLVHAHNFLAVALWWAWRPRQTRLHWIPLALFAAASGGLLLGAFDGILVGLVERGPQSPALGDHLRALAPGMEPVVALRWVFAFAFAQSVHYAVWLRLVPEDDRDRVSPRTFRGSYRALVADLGPWVLVGAVLAAIGLAVWATFDLARARVDYLRFAEFHVVLELCVAALLLVEARRFVRRPHPSPTRREEVGRS